MDARNLLIEAEMRAERTVAYVRLTVPLVAGTMIYVASNLSPSSFQDLIEKQATIVMSYNFVYFSIGLVSLVVARPRWFRNWMPWVFTSCDLAVWILFVLSSVKILGLPLNYVALSPPTWLASAMLAFGVLRFNPWLQAYITIVVAGALFVVIILPQPISDSAGRVAGQFDHLLETPSNIRRLAMFVFGGLVLVLAMARARELLNRAVEETVRRTNLTRYLPLQLVERMAETGEQAMRAGRQQDAAVLFVDIRAFTALAEGMDPEVLSQFLGEFRRVVTRAVDGWSGVVDKFVGDSAMVVFGVPEPGSRDAANALDAARAILSAVASWNDERDAVGDDGIRIGIGVHWGRVFCGAVGDDSRLEFTVLGDTVNVAARLEEATKSAGYPLVVSEALLDAAGVEPADEDGWVMLPDAAIRGRDGDVRHFGTS